MGQEPALTRTLPAFQYSSHVSLQAPSGHMWFAFSTKYFYMKLSFFFVFVLGERLGWKERTVIHLIVGFRHFHWKVNRTVDLPRHRMRCE